MLSYLTTLIVYVTMISAAYGNWFTGSGCGDIVRSKSLSLKEPDQSVYTLIINEMSNGCVELKLINKQYNFTHQNVIYSDQYNSYHKQSSTSSNIDIIQSQSQLHGIIVFSIESDKSYKIRKDVPLGDDIANYDLNIPLTFIQPSYPKLLSLTDRMILEIDSLTKTVQSMQQQQNKLNRIIQELKKKTINTSENSACTSSKTEIVNDEIEIINDTWFTWIHGWILALWSICFWINPFLGLRNFGWIKIREFDDKEGLEETHGAWVFYVYKVPVVLCLLRIVNNIAFFLMG